MEKALIKNIPQRHPRVNLTQQALSNLNTLKSQLDRIQGKLNKDNIKEVLSYLRLVNVQLDLIDEELTDEVERIPI